MVPHCMSGAEARAIVCNAVAVLPRAALLTVLSAAAAAAPIAAAWTATLGPSG